MDNLSHLTSFTLLKKRWVTESQQNIRTRAFEGALHNLTVARQSEHEHVYLPAWETRTASRLQVTSMSPVRGLDLELSIGEILTVKCDDSCCNLFSIKQ